MWHWALLLPWHVKHKLHLKKDIQPNPALFSPSGRWVFGQLYSEHLVSRVPTLQCHCCHRPVAALQCGGKAVPRRRPPLPHWLLASCQEDPADYPTRNLCELLMDVAPEVKSKESLIASVIYFRIHFGFQHSQRDLPGTKYSEFLQGCWRCLTQIIFMAFNLLEIKSWERGSEKLYTSLKHVSSCTSLNTTNMK